MAKLTAPPDMIILNANGTTTEVYIKAQRNLTATNYTKQLSTYASIIRERYESACCDNTILKGDNHDA